MTTEPLTPAGCDLSDFPRMMLDIRRLRGSSFDATLNDAAWRAGLNLWMTAWHQVPAGSLPDDDRQLAAMAGRSLRSWRRMRPAALSGWVKCDDGRLYHPDLAETVNIIWPKVVAQRHRMNRRVEIMSDEWAALRGEVFARDNYTCTYCQAVGERLECDHIIPVVRGGPTVVENLTTACGPCNRSKGAKTLEEWAGRQ